MNRKLVLYINILLFASVLFISACSSGSHLQNDEPGPESNDRMVYDYAEIEETETIELPRIGIYNGKGSWELNVRALKNFLNQYGYTWAVFDETYIDSENLNDNYDLIWFPGGFAAEYKHFINDHQNIRSFIEHGGLYVGSCAGAYYAADILRWLDTDHDYPLNLFAGKAVGPMADLIGWGETASFELEENNFTNIGFESSVEFYYFDGPYFEPYDQDTVKVLARYSVNMEPAVIAGSFGDGKYLLLGPHPELGGYSLESADYSIDGENGAQWEWLHSILLWFSQY